MPLRGEQCDDEVALVDEVESITPFRRELRYGAEVKEGVVRQIRFVRKVQRGDIYAVDFDGFWDFLRKLLGPKPLQILSTTSPRVLGLV